MNSGTQKSFHQKKKIKFRAKTQARPVKGIGNQGAERQKSAKREASASSNAAIGAASPGLGGQDYGLGAIDARDGENN